MTTTYTTTCPICSGTGRDEAFDSDCQFCKPGAYKGIEGKVVGFLSSGRRFGSGTGTAAPRAAAPTPTATPNLDALVTWLESQTRSTFAQSVAAQYRRTGRLSAAQVAAAERMQARTTTPAAEAPAAAPKAPVAEITEGMYWFGARVVRVVTSDEGHLYAKPFDEETGKFGYERGLIGQMRREGARRMTLEEGTEYSRKVGKCCVCARTLTRKSSIEAGIGPICASKF